MDATSARSSSWFFQKRCMRLLSMYSQFTSTGLLNCMQCGKRLIANCWNCAGWQALNLEATA